MSEAPVRVGLDLDGSLESLGNSMTDLADALVASGECELVRFRTLHRAGPGEYPVAGRALWAPWWRRSLGRPVDALLAAVDVVHVAGLATPPCRRVPLVVSVDDLRPLRGESRTHQRINQLRRAVGRGATLVASSRTASHEVLEVLGVERHQVVVVPPAVPLVAPTVDGRDLVVNVTGSIERFEQMAPALIRAARTEGARVVVLASATVGQRVAATDLEVTVRPRAEARAALAQARVVVHLSDGARFPSFAIAAFAAGVPTLARSTTINRELLAGAAELLTEEHDVAATVTELLTSDARRAIMVAAGRSRALDYAPSTAARAYAALYRDVVRGWEA